MSHLSFNLFKEAVVEGIKDYMPESFAEFVVETKEVVKNNDTVLIGLTLRDPEGPNIVPTLYLEDFYREYSEGKTMDEVLEQIADVYAKAYDECPVDGSAEELVANMTDYESIKEKILPRLVNVAANKKRLETLPYSKIADLAIIYNVVLGESSDGGTMSIVIGNDLFEKWEISLEELLDKALSNLLNQSCEIKSMAETLAGMMVPGFEDMSDEEKADAIEELEVSDQGAMYVISNESKTFGATALLNPEFMKKVIEKIGTDDFFILPSSVHECILVPQRDGKVELSTLEEMVREVNQTQVAPNEVLSDTVYRYDAKLESIYVAVDDSKEACESAEIDESEDSFESEDTVSPLEVLLSVYPD